MRAAMLVTLGVLAASMVTTSVDTSLRELAAAEGKFIGTAVAVTPLAGESAYREIAAGEFSQVTAENAMKWDALQPSQGQFSWSGADAVVAFAQQNDQQVHGHTLVWHSQTPGWVQNLGADALRTAMRDHITTVVGRYASNPVVRSWDVVNEVFDDNGNLRSSFWQQKLGPSYIADAFRHARAADPDARLCINDYNVEGVNAKSTAMYELVRSLRAQDVPVDCVGLQAHLAIQYGLPGQLQQNLQRFADLGVEVRITELDVRMQLPRDAAKDATQATYYAALVDACLAVTRCSGITTWGFTDKYSWVPDTFPGQGAALLYDQSYTAKPAYTAIHDALSGGTTPPDTSPPTSPGAPTATAITSTGARLTWAASTDNIGVSGYDVHRGATRIGTATTPEITLTGLSPATEHVLHLVARDAAGNLSAPSPTVTFRTAAAPVSGCSATPAVANAWQGGFQGGVTVKNLGTTASGGWTMTVRLPPGATVANAWGVGRTTQTGDVVEFANAPWNGTLQPGGTASAGFIATWPGTGSPVLTALTCTTS